jgi:8-oxo-dGTP pyrophosphatase MutT (NUDIX family)
MSDSYPTSEDMSLPLVRSAGGVVYRKTADDYQVILVGSGEPTQWRLPKGIIDPEESVAQAALREVREESGAIVEIDTEIDVADWTYEYDGVLYRKETTYFLMKYIGGDIDQHDHEYEHVIWVSLQNFIHKLHFESERSIARKGALLLGFGESEDV